jgi:hypothetical protein
MNFFYTKRPDWFFSNGLKFKVYFSEIKIIFWSKFSAKVGTISKGHENFRANY